MITIIVKVNGSEYDLDDFYDLDEVLEEVNAHRGDDWTVKQMLDQTDWSESNIHERYQSLNVYEYVEALQYLSLLHENAQDLLEAAIECGVDITIPRYILDTYLGCYKSDADYAQQHAEESGIDTTTWPYNCIDWDAAASELGLAEHNNHYFI
jgi:hypothetical protein